MSEKTVKFGTTCSFKFMKKKVKKKNMVKLIDDESDLGDSDDFDDSNSQ